MLDTIARTAARAGDFATVDTAVGGIDGPQRNPTLAATASIASDSGDHERAAALATRIGSGSHRTAALAEVVVAWASDLESDEVTRLTPVLIALTDQIDATGPRTRPLIAVVLALAAARAFADAAALAHRTENPAQVLAALVIEVLKAGDPRLAAGIAAQISVPSLAVPALVSVVEALVAADDLDAATALAAEIPVPERQAAARARIAAAHVRRGEIGRATAVARDIADPDEQMSILSLVIEAATAAGDDEAADTAASHVTDEFTGPICSPRRRPGRPDAGPGHARPNWRRGPRQSPARSPSPTGRRPRWPCSPGPRSTPATPTRPRRARPGDDRTGRPRGHPGGGHCAGGRR